MNADAYAGFLKLLLTPTSKIPPMSAELDAYLRYANEREPVPITASRSIGSRSKQAA